MPAFGVKVVLEPTQKTFLVLFVIGEVYRELKAIKVLSKFKFWVIIRHAMKKKKLQHIFYSFKFSSRMRMVPSMQNKKKMAAVGSSWGQAWLCTDNTQRQQMTHLNTRTCLQTWGLPVSY